MKLNELLKVALEGLTTNKARSLLTMLGVIIGVAAVIIMMAVSAGTEQTIADQINSLGANLLFVSGGFSGGGPEAARESMQLGLVYDDVDAIAGVAGVAGVSVEQRTSQMVKYGGTAVDAVNVMGVTPDFPSVREVEVATGRFFSATEVERKTKVAVIGSSLATELFGTADPIGEKITVGDTKLTVIGVMAAKGTTGGEDWDTRIYTPITVVFQKWNWDRMAAVTGYRVNTIYVQVAEDADMDKVAEQIELLLVKRHDTTLADSPYSIATQADIIETQASTTAAFRSLLGWVAGVSLMVGGIGIMNIMLVSVTERTQEIGVREAVGATGRDIRGQFLAEALALSLVGGLLGVASGVGGARLFSLLGDMRTVIVPSSIVLAFTSAALVGIFFGYYPASKAAQLDPIESLRHE